MPVSESVETPVRPQSPLKRPLKEPSPREEKAEVGEKVHYHRQALESIKMHRKIKAQVAEDIIAEERHLDALVALGEKLTAEETHRKAIHVATREAADRKEPLTELLVAQVEERLKVSQK